jgi:hypothetical protein
VKWLRDNKKIIIILYPVDKTVSGESIQTPGHWRP